MMATKRTGTRPEYTTHERMRLGHLAKAITSPLRSLVTWVTSPAAVIRWLKRYQERMAQENPNHKSQEGGRPPVAEETIKAIVTIYGRGLTGLKRIQGELRKCGIDVARSTIRRVLDAQGLPPHDGPSQSTWGQFMRNHSRELVSIDFLQVATGLLGTIQYQFALVAIEHDTRRVHLLGVSPQPNHQWLSNVIRSATMDGMPLSTRRYWIHDNDRKFQTLDTMLEQSGLEGVATSPFAPDMNALIERFFGSLRRECLDHLVALSPSHLERALKAYIDHHNTERPHQGIGNVVIGPWQAQTQGAIVCDERLGGLLKSFRRAA
jgi:transposase InsO family protein